RPAQPRAGDDRHHPLPAAPQLHRARPRPRDEQWPDHPVRRARARRGAGAEGLRAARRAAGSGAMTDFVRSFRDRFASLGNGPIQPLREAAFARFNHLGLPTTQDEDWKYTSLAPLAQLRFEAPARAVLPEIGRWTLGDGAIQLVFVDG